MYVRWYLRLSQAQRRAASDLLRGEFTLLRRWTEDPDRQGRPPAPREPRRPPPTNKVADEELEREAPITHQARGSRDVRERARTKNE